MGTKPRQGEEPVSPTVQALRQIWSEEQRHPLTPEEQQAVQAAWEYEMAQLDAAYETMLDAEPALRQRLQDGSAVLDMLLDAVAEDRGER